jgi:cytochrome b
LTEHEISFISKAFADSDEKGESDNHKRQSRSDKDFQRAGKNEKDKFWKEIHETIAYFSLFLISIHIFGVLVSSLVHGENLIKAMVTGRKQAI